MALNDCIKSAGLSEEEVRIYNDLVEKHQAEGMSPEEAQRAAVETRLSELATDKNDIKAKVLEAIGEPDQIESEAIRALFQGEPAAIAEQTEIVETVDKDEITIVPQQAAKPEAEAVDPAEAWAEHNIVQAEKVGLDPDQIREIAADPDTDPLTGLYTDAELLPAIERAAASAEPFTYTESDTFNLGGINKAMGANARADAVLKEIADVYAEAFAGNSVFRRGAGRFAAITPEGFDAASAIEQVNAGVSEVIKNNNLEDIAAPKVPGEKGARLYSGITKVQQGGTIGDTISKAQEQINAEIPQGEENVNREQAFKTWADKASGQTEGIAARIAKDSEQRGTEFGQVITASERQSLERAAARPESLIAEDGRAFATPDKVRQEAFNEAVKSAGITTEQAEPFRPTTHRDSLTGWFTDRDRIPTIERAQQLVEDTGIDAVYVVADISNLGGLNLALGDKLADIVFRNMAQIVGEKAAQILDAESIPFRHGGDEISFVITGADQATVQKAVEQAAAEVSGYAEAIGIQDLPHAKALTDKSKKGSGVYIGVQRIGGTDSNISDTVDSADAIVELNKMEPRAKAVPVELAAVTPAVREFEQAAPEKNLFVAHNLSAENLLHADKVGGLAVPSLAISKTDTGFENFGEISLIADKSLLQDPSAKTFGADIYSPRYPQVTYQIDLKKYNEIVEPINKELKSIGLDFIRSDIESRGIGELYYDTGARYTYLKSLGKEPKLTYKKKEPVAAYLRKFKGDRFDIIRNDEFKEAAKKYYAEKAKKNAKAMSDRKGGEYDFWLKDWTTTFFDDEGNVNYRHLEDLAYSIEAYHKPKQVDGYELDRKLNDKLKTTKSQQEFKNWIEDTFSEVVAAERIFKGFTPSGNRKYIAHTLDNVVKEMKAKLRGGENFNYGVGTIRSATAPQFKNIKQIQKAREKIVSKEVMEDLKKESSDEFDSISESLKPYYKYDSNRFGYYDAAAENLFDMARGRGLPDFENVPSDVRKEAAEFLAKLRDMPTEYFESKIQRAVDINEFVAAVVPKGTSQRVKDVLKKNGLKIKQYDPNIEGDRSIQIESLDKQLDVLFQPTGKPTARASIQFTEANESIIRLSRAADLSSFLHESAHLFLEMESRFAAKFGQSEEQKVLLDWLGVESFDQIGKEQHEKFAETFEVYLRTGKAPSLKLRDAFAAFARWLTVIYRKLTDPRLARAELTPEITEYMDRMLATEEELQQAEANPAYDEFFKDKEAAGMTDEEWIKYQKQRAKVRDTATIDLQQKVIDEYKKRKTKEWNDEKVTLIEEERERLEELPLYRLLNDALETPIDRAALKEIAGVTRLPAKLNGRTAEGGVDPQEVAEAYGYESVNQMFDEIDSQPTLNQAADEAAEQRMKDKYGDMLNDGRIELEAREAMHNEEQAKLLLMELRALNKTAPEINRDYLKAEAKRIIESMTYKEMRPNKYYMAEIRAAQKAAKAESIEDQSKFKLQQLVNHYLYREAINSKESMNKYRKFIRGVQTREYKAASVVPDYSANMKTLANMYDLKNKQAKMVDMMSILEWYEAQVADENQYVNLMMMDENLLAALEAKRQGRLREFELPTFDDMTFSQLRSVRDMLKHMRYVGGQFADGVDIEVKKERGKLIDSVLEHGGDDVKVTRGVPTKYERMRRQIQHAVNKLPSLRNLTRRLDGFDEHGEAYQTIFQKVEQANNAKLDLAKEMYNRFEEEMGDIHNLGLDRKMEEFTLANGETFNIHAEGKFMLALYMGTESSRESIYNGFGMIEADVIQILQTLTPDQLKLVNATWRVNESMWPELSSAHVKLYGVAPAKLTATPFTINGYELTGGHMRLFYDSTELELKSEEKNQPSFAGIMPNKAGSLHARVGSGGRPPLLDINNIVRSIEDNVHYIAFAETGAHLRRIINHNEVKAAIEQKHSIGFYKALIETIEGVTGNHVQRESVPMLAALSRLLRRAATMKYLAYSLRNTVQQFSAIPIAMDEIGSINWTNQLIRFASPNNHEKFKSFVNERSSFMDNRASLVNREAAEYLRKISVSGKAEHAWQLFSRFGFAPQTAVDSMVAYPVWMAKYQAEIEIHQDEARAISAADTAVSESVGSGSDLHLGGAFQMNNAELTKLFTVFGTWFNAYYNRMYRASKGTMSPLQSYESFKAIVIMPMIVAALSSALVYDGPEDDEEWAEWAMKRYLAFMGGTVPLLRDVVSSFSGFAPKTVFSGGLEMPARVYSELMSYSEEKESGLKFFTDVLGTVTSAVPIPGSGNFTRLLDYTEAYTQGKEGQEYEPLRGTIAGKTR